MRLRVGVDELVERRRPAGELVRRGGCRLDALRGGAGAGREALRPARDLAGGGRELGAAARELREPAAEGAGRAVHLLQPGAEAAGPLRGGGEAAAQLAGAGAGRLGPAARPCPRPWPACQAAVQLLRPRGHRLRPFGELARAGVRAVQAVGEALHGRAGLRQRAAGVAAVLLDQVGGLLRGRLVEEPGRGREHPAHGHVHGAGGHQSDQPDADRPPRVPRAGQRHALREPALAPLPRPLIAAGPVAAKRKSP